MSNTKGHQMPVWLEASGRKSWRVTTGLSTIKFTKIILSLRGCVTTAITAPEILLFGQKGVFL